jgi:hypothetical protein
MSLKLAWMRVVRSRVILAKPVLAETESEITRRFFLSAINGILDYHEKKVKQNKRRIFP